MPRRHWMGVGVCIAASLSGAETRVSTVRVDAKTGRLIRTAVKPQIRTPAARAPKDAAAFPLDEMIARVSRQYGIRPSFVHAVIKTESNYNPAAISPKGAMGLMQLMPQTARRFGVSNVFNPAENLEGGVRYLRYLLDTYGPRTDLSLAAYNAGEGAVQRYRGMPPYLETRQFVQRVNRRYEAYRAQERLAPPAVFDATDRGRVVRVVEPSGVVRYTNSQ